MMLFPPPPPRPGSTAAPLQPGAAPTAPGPMARRPGGRSSRLARAAVAALVALGALGTLSSCGGGDEVDTAGDTTTSAKATTSRATTTRDTTTTTADDLAFRASTEPEPATTTTTADVAPVTTVRIAPPSAVGSLYRGVIGFMGVNEIVTEAVAGPPPIRPGVQPLTGLKGQPADRPAAVVKVDNGPAAQPHTGLNAADIVIEEEVEGGVTRFAAIFHSRSSIVGPVRSGRTTDLTLISSLGRPLLLYSGANEVIDGILRRQTLIQNRSFATSSGYWRDSSRSAPSNLYTDTAAHWASAEGTVPVPQFAYRDAGESVDGQGADEIVVDYGRNRAVWHWVDGEWKRSQRGKRHLLVDGEQVTAANVVVIEADEVDTGLVDSSGGMVPEFVFVGSGRAVVFTNGKRVDGVWTRPSLGAVATLTGPSGQVIELTPGRTWIELIRAGSGALG